MSEQRSRRGLLRAVAAGAGAGLTGCLSASGSERTRVFHAGSLAPPFSATEAGFEAETGIDVTREAWGSVAATRRITAQGMRADVLGVADFRLLRDRLLPEYGDWYAVFATNAMGIQYHPDSPGAEDLSRENWWEVLTREDVTVGHADPALDPGGYRAVMVQQLGAVPFEGERLYDEDTYRRLRSNAAVTTGNETNLEGQVRSGKVDYALYYRSLGTTSDLPYLDLQPQVNLARTTPAYAAHYAEASVETDTGTYTGAPIAYGISVPSVARNAAGGARWVEYVLGDAGRTDLREAGLTPVDSPVVPANSESAVPERLRSYVEPRSRLGPLDL